jgi:hypothetical protein
LATTTTTTTSVGSSRSPGVVHEATSAPTMSGGSRIRKLGTATATAAVTVESRPTVSASLPEIVAHAAIVTSVHDCEHRKCGC